MKASRRAFAALCLFSLALLLAPPVTTADVQPDVLDSYQIAITPQSDGMLTIDYTLVGYHVMSDWPANEPYLQLGVPNSSFTIASSGSDGADVSSVVAETGSTSLVQFNFGTLPRTGDVFDLHLEISQGQMAYPENGDVNFKFIPSGWTFPITVSQMTVTWANPSDPTLLKSVQPAPTTGDTAMSWHWDNPQSDASGMFAGEAIDVAYDPSAFTLSGSAIGQQDGSNGSSGSGSTALAAIQWLFFIVMFGGIIWSWVSKTDGYHGGSGLRPGGIPYHGTGFSHSCACACAGCACACACACAGGGRVGCSRKAIGIACLAKVLRMADRVDSTPGEET